MSERRLGVYPGAFDPPTLGHVDVVRRALAVFDRVVVAVAENPSKTHLLPAEERRRLFAESVSGLDGVTVDVFGGLTVDYVGRCGAAAIVRGVRTMSDFDYESHLALTNRAMSGVETVFILASPQVGFISSSLVREIARMGGDVSSMVPPPVVEALRAAFGR
jgi:pantetheine-phosphate adenylyltransferase